LIGGSAGHVNDRKVRINLSGVSRNIPAVQFATQIDVGDERAVLFPIFIEESGGFFARSRNCHCKAALSQGVFNKALD